MGANKYNNYNAIPAALAGRARPQSFSPEERAEINRKLYNTPSAKALREALAAHKVKQGITTTKTSSPVAGHTSPVQANMNMGGSAVSSSPATISDMRHALFNEPGSKGPAHMLRHALYAPDQPGALPTAKMKRVYNKVIDRQVRKNKVLDTGPRGGRFYISENGTKVYVK